MEFDYLQNALCYRVFITQITNLAIRSSTDHHLQCLTTTWRIEISKTFWCIFCSHEVDIVALISKRSSVQFSLIILTDLQKSIRQVKMSQDFLPDLFHLCLDFSSFTRKRSKNLFDIEISFTAKKKLHRTSRGISLVWSNKRSNA